MDFCNMKNVANFEPYEFQISEYYLAYKNYQFVWEAFDSSVPFFYHKIIADDLALKRSFIEMHQWISHKNDL